VTGFVIHALHVGGGTLALAPLPGSAGDYASDLSHIRDWKPALVISLTEAAERTVAGASGFGADLQDTGTRWIAFPVPDFSVPSPDQHMEWRSASHAARAALNGGGRVMIQCRGGCGRSGMVALRLMIETGETPNAALRRLRAVRPCAIETEAQMAWALRG